MDKEKVVKCGNEQCGLRFGYSEVNTACPFCHTPYKNNEEKNTEKPKDKKITMKIQRESFKIWKEEDLKD